MNPVETFIQRNQTFAARDFKAGLTLMPQLRALVLGCMDPRVDPAEVLGLGLGEAAVIRNVGGRLTPAVRMELSMLQTLARAGGAPPGRFDLVVLHHTDCGIVRLEGQRQMLATFFGVGEDELGTKAVGDPRASVIADVAALRALPLPPGWVVSGLLYDVNTGWVETVVSADQGGVQ
jgi:carbonic anhydrase